MKTKFVSGAVVADASLGDRQIRVVANSGKSDRVKDVLVAKGCKLDNYLLNPIVLAQHDPEQPIGNFAPEIKDGQLVGIITFAPSGVSAKADEYCGLYKAGVLKTVSVGFKPLVFEQIKGGGVRYDEWELMELSGVSVPCDPGAVVTARSLKTKADGEAWKVGASRNLPIGASAEAWDGAAAAAAIFEKAGFDSESPDVNFARKGFLAYDSANPRLKSAYKQPFATIVDGRLTAMPAGIRAASLAPRADLPPEAAEKARAVVDHYEAEMKDKGLAPGVKTGFVVKDLWDVSCIAQLLMQLGWAHSSSAWEAEIEGDGSKVPAMLAEALRQLAAAFEAMAAEEVAELLAGRGLEAAEDADVVEAGAPSYKLKAWRATFAKAGRAISQANQDLIDQAMAHLDQAADCHVKAADSHDDANDAIAEARDHLGEATKCMKGVGRKPKPSANSSDDVDPNTDDGDGGDPEADVELAARVERQKAAARRQREIELLAFGDAP